MVQYELSPKYDRAKSFYGKAVVVEEYNSVSLISYNSCICQISKVGCDDVRVKIYNVTDYYGNSLTFSNTSLRHLKEFLLQNGLRAESKSQICKDYDIADGGQTDAKSGR